jgi:hypothetical protein
MGEMVGYQTANQAAKPLKKGEKKSHQFWNGRIAGLVVFSSLVSSPVCEIWQNSCSFIRSWCGEAFHDLSL